MAEENPRGSLPLEQPTEPLPRLYNDLLGENRAPEKTTWPELVGKSVEEAESKIKEEMPTANVNVLPSDSFYTLDFQPQRVRLFADTDGKVSKTPQIG